MIASSPRDDSSRNRRLMRHGLVLTGCGLLGLMLAAMLLIQGTGVAPVALATLATGGMLVAGAGFGIMVVAADPFADCDLDSDSDTDVA